MKRLYLYLLFSLSICQVYSQQSDCQCSSDEDYGIRLRTGLIGAEYHNPVEGYEGEQYFNDWTAGDIMLINGEVIEGIFIRYEKYLDELLWLRDTDFKKGILNKNIVGGFRLYDNKKKLAASFIKKKIVLPMTDSADVFLQVLVSGQISLYAYRNVNIASNDYILSDNTKYLISAQGHDFMLTLTRKSLLDIPVMQRKEMKSILRKNRIAVKDNEQQLIMAVSLYNSTHQQ